MFKFKIIKVLVLVLCLGMLCGCWNMKDTQDLSYAVSAGFDYMDGNYVMYTQFADTNNIAKQDGPQPIQQAPIYLLKGVGRTPNEAAFQLYKASQERIYWGHLDNIMITDRALKQGLGISKIFDLMNRYYEIRMNIWNVRYK